MKKYIKAIGLMLLIAVATCIHIDGVCRERIPDVGKTISEDKALLITHIVDGDRINIYRDNVTQVLYLCDADTGMMCYMVDTKGNPLTYKEWIEGRDH